MTAAAVTVADYVSELSSARAELDRLSEPDKSLGLAAIRLEAAQLYKQLATTGRPELQGLQPLRDWVDTAAGGELAQQSLDQVESFAVQRANEAVSAVASAAAGSQALAGGVVGFLLFWLGAFTDVTQSLGHSVGTALVSGAIPGVVAYYLMRAVGPTGQAAQGTLRWANSVGAQADARLRTARTLGATLWASAGGSATPPGLTVTSRAQRAATWIVGVCGVVLGIGLISFGIGLVAAVQEASARYG